jgi:hypothetical protein
LAQPPKPPEEESIENMGEFIGKMINVSSVVFLPLNFFAGIVGGIWLLFFKEWRLVLGGFVFSLFFPTLYALISLIQMPLMAIMNHLSKKQKTGWLSFVGFINLTLTNLFHLFLVIATITLMLTSAQGKISIPFLLFGYSVILSPFQYMASKEPGDAIGTWLGLFFMQTAYIVLAATVALGLGFFGLLSLLVLMFYLETFQIKAVKYESAQGLF